MEDAPKEPAFEALMESLPMGKTLVARVTRRQEPYAIVLFDTSTNEDINLNDKVFESLAQHLVKPSLPPVSTLVQAYHSLLYMIVLAIGDKYGCVIYSIVGLPFP